jgi:hypothetical protein
VGHLKNTRTINVPVYNVSMEDDILNIDTSIAVTLVFPNIRDSGCMYADKRWYVNDANGTASVNPVTIISVSGIQVNDGASQEISTDNFGTSIFATSENKYIITGTGSGSGGSTIVETPFVPNNTPIIVGDDFQIVAEKAQGQINDIFTNVTILENNEFKITYYAEINAASGTITKPTGSTILLDQFFGGIDAVISTISGGKPTGEMPLTSSGELVDVTSFDTSGNFVLSDAPSAYPCALIYTIKISQANYSNLDLNFVIEYEGISNNYLSQSSGLINGGQITINSLDNTKIDIAPLTGILVDYWTTAGKSIIYEVNYAGGTGLTVDFLNANTFSFIGIDKTNTIVQFANIPTNEERRDAIILGQLGHANLTTVNAVNDYTSVYASPIEQYRDLVNEIYLINDGNIVYPNGSNLNINKTSGNLFGLGINFHNNEKDPNVATLAALIIATFRYRTQTGGSTTPVSLIDPTKYDNAGTITTIGGSGNQATNQRVFLFPNNNIVIQYGQTIYGTLSQAVSNSQSETFVKFSNLNAAILIGIISVTKDCTDLSNTSKARFILTTKFGENIGGSAGISVSTLQNAYNNSTDPEIVTDSTRGAVTFKRGSAADTDNVIEVQNASAVTKFYVTGNGEFQGRVKRRVLTIVSSSTPTVNTDECDMVNITALAVAITSMTTNLSGTPTDGQLLQYQIKDNGTARAITWGASFVALGQALPTTTTLGKTMNVLFIWNTSLSKWGCLDAIVET